MITRLKLSTIEQGLPKYRSMLAGNDAYIPTSFESIATLTTIGPSSSFTSIPGTYQHLQIRINWMDATFAPQDLRLRFNGDTGSNYYTHRLFGSGSAVFANSTSGTGIFAFNDYNGSSATQPNVLIIDIHDYASTTKNKTVRVIAGQDQNNTSGQISLISGAWFNTSAITSINLGTTSNGNSTTGTSAALYGIKG